MAVTLLGKGTPAKDVKFIGKGTNKETRAKVNAWIKRGTMLVKVVKP